MAKGCPHARHVCNRCARLPGRTAAAVETLATIWIPLFYVDQNQSSPTPYQVTKEQALAMQAAGRGQFINHKKAFQLCERSPVRLNFTCSASTDSTASISLSEMEANVGITPNNGSPNEPALRHIVIRAKQKIRAIGGRLDGTYDARAPLAFGAVSWPLSQS